MNNPTALLFDLDGTLVDTRQDITANVNRALADHGLPALTLEQAMRHVGFGAEVLIKRCLLEFLHDSQISSELVKTTLDGFRDHYAAHMVEHATVYPGTRNFLDAFPAPKAVISNKPEFFVQGVLNGMGLDSYFEFAWGKDSTENPKPSGGVILEALEILSVPSSKRVWFIGDSPVDVHAAKAAGSTSMMISHGFASREDLINSKPDYLASSFPELLGMIT
jgi:phosphoglycolate phosphatase